MSEKCNDFCKDHSMCLEKFANTEKEISNLKTALDMQKGYLEGRLNSTVSDMKDLRKELMDKMDLGFKEIKEIIDAKETSKDGKFWLIIGTVCSPIIVIILQKLVEHFIK